MTERLPLIPPDKQTAEQKQVLAELLAGPRGKLQGPFVAMLRAPEMMRRVQVLGEQLRFRCVLGERLKELAILIVARRWTQQTEFYLHRPMAEAAGVTPAVADAIALGQRPATLTADEAIIYDYCTEMLAGDFQVSDATWARVVGRFGEQGVVELTGVCGYYTLLAMIMNSARTALPGDATPPLKPL
jgi:4-carboxymuconolactone decarboxylase